MINILPNNDLKQHKEDSTCDCKPSLIEQNGEIILIHNSYDKRELKENIVLNTEQLMQGYKKGLITKQEIDEMLELAILEEEYEVAISIRDVIACL